jgi:hypothetical protein
LEGLATMYCEIAFWGSCGALSFLLLQETADANDLRIRGDVARKAASSGVWGTGTGNPEQVSMLTPVVN